MKGIKISIHIFQPNIWDMSNSNIDRKVVMTEAIIESFAGVTDFTDIILIILKVKLLEDKSY